MKNICVDFGLDLFIICVPDNIESYHKKYQRMFDKWVDRDPDFRGLYVEINGKKGKSFGVDDFVDYLNEYHINDQNEKAFVLKRNVSYDDYPKNMKVLYF